AALHAAITTFIAHPLWCIVSRGPLWRPAMTLLLFAGFFGLHLASLMAPLLESLFAELPAIPDSALGAAVYSSLIKSNRVQFNLRMSPALERFSSIHLVSPPPVLKHVSAGRGSALGLVLVRTCEVTSAAFAAAEGP